MTKKKIIAVIGTRPDAIKMSPLIKELKKSDCFETITVSTGQHTDMLNQVLDCFDIKPDENLEIMTENQTVTDITEKVLVKMDSLIKKYSPDVILVHGDTTSAFASALAGFYNRIPVGHIEAGLRTYNKYSPYPEEYNRVSIDYISEYLFAPTQKAEQNLIREGLDKAKIFVTGNTVVDALKTTKDKGNNKELIEWVRERKLVLLTSHRRENLGEKMKDIFKAIGDITDKFDDWCCIYPVHKNPKVREEAFNVLKDRENILLTEPLDTFDFHNLMSMSDLIITDSGGIQEEAPSFDVPVFVIRDYTERPEGIEAGCAKLIGTEYEKIYDSVLSFIQTEGKEFANMKNPYGDGHASERIRKILEESFKQNMDI